MRPVRPRRASSDTVKRSASKRRWRRTASGVRSGSTRLRQRAKLWEFVGGLAGRGTTVIFSTHDIQEAERYGGRLLVLADGEALFDGSPDELRETVREESDEAGAAAADRDFETAFVAYLHHRGH